MNRRNYAMLILAAWIGALGWLGIRQLNQPASSALDPSTRSISPGSNFYALAVAGTQVGFASSTVDTVPEGLVFDDRLLFELDVAGGTQRTETRTVASLSNDLRLRRFDATIRNDAGRYVVSGVLTADSIVSVTFTDGNRQYQQDVLVDPRVVLPAHVPLQLIFGQEPTLGSTDTIPVFDPLLLERYDVIAHVLADSVMLIPDSAVFDSSLREWRPARWDTLRTWNVEYRSRGVHSSMWIDELGGIATLRTENGFDIDRGPFEITFNNFQARPDVVTEPSNGVMRLPALVAGIVKSTADSTPRHYRVVGMSTTNLALEGDGQSLTNDVVTVTMAGVGPMNARYRLPVDSGYTQYLTSTPLIRSDDPRVEAQARLIIERTRNPRRAVERLVAWTSSEIAQTISVGLPNALSVLEARRGNAGEHALLFVSMARAVGVPARLASGLLHEDGRYYFHTWAEVLMDSWVSVDPTYGLFPAGSEHLRLKYGELGRPHELVPALGDLRVVAVTVEELTS